MTSGPIITNKSNRQLGERTVVHISTNYSTAKPSDTVVHTFTYAQLLVLSFVYTRGRVITTLSLSLYKLSWESLFHTYLCTSPFSEHLAFSAQHFKHYAVPLFLFSSQFPAQKVLHLQNDHGEKSFKAECGVLQKVRHRNLVKIITSCSNLNFKGLVFEFMSNGSLEKHLYPNRDGNDGEDVCELGLKARLDIAIDVAHAMEYLHHDSFVQVVHCDLKPSNVLLDRDMSAHVTDFGIARIIGESSTVSLTSTLSLRGSTGYIAPEYGLSEIVSTQGDVYSYGILLLEILTRRQPTSDMFVGDLNLHNWVNSTFPNRVKEVIDNVLFSEVDGDEFEENNVYKCLVSLLHVGLLCSKHSLEERPTMKVVVAVLERIREVLIANSVTSRRLRRSISNLISNSNTTNIDALASNNQSSSTF